MDPPHITTAPVAASTPVVLQIMPLLGSQAPIGYIYDPTPARDGDGGLLAAASAFFAHQGHQVFLDPCPDLAAYHRAGGIAEPAIIDVDRLPDHVLSAGLDLLDSSPAPSAVDSLGLSFMASYLLAPAPAGPHFLYGGRYRRTALLCGQQLPFWGVRGWGALSHVSPGLSSLTVEHPLNSSHSFAGECPSPPGP